jgi:hypothetical protein
LKKAGLKTSDDKKNLYPAAMSELRDHSQNLLLQTAFTASVNAKISGVKLT